MACPQAHVRSTFGPKSASSPALSVSRQNSRPDQRFVGDIEMASAEMGQTATFGDASAFLPVPADAIAPSRPPPRLAPLRFGRRARPRRGWDGSGRQSVANVKYDGDTKRKVHAALEAALDRMGLLRRKPTYWEADCLSKALTAISLGKYGLAQSQINCSLLPPLDGWRPPANASDGRAPGGGVAGRSKGRERARSPKAP